MNIIFLTRGDPTDKKVWSGTLYHIYHKLREKHNVMIIGTEVLRQIGFFTKDNFSVIDLSTSKRYIKDINRLLNERICAKGFDLVFLGDIFFVPFLDVDIPIVYLSDTSYEQRSTHFGEPDVRQFESCIQHERLTLEKSHKIIYSSEWIKGKAVEFYKIDPRKIHVIEFGANIPTPLVYTIEIKMDVCRLVYIGRNWIKKGGDKAFQAYKQLKSEGFPCTLSIIGSVPQEQPDIDEGLTIISYLDKSIGKQSDQLCKILSDSHFLVLPTEFDAFGIVFCEASAYGVPSIAANVGGVSQPVREGKNGFLLASDATAHDYAEKIKTVFSDKENYIKLRASSRREFETRLNWDVWGEQVNTILTDAVREWKLR